MKYYELIKKEILENNGIVTRKFCTQNKIPSVYLTRMVRDNKLVKINAGIYKEPDAITDDQSVIQYRNSKVIFSYYTALMELGVGNFIPKENFVTVPTGYKLSNIKNFKLRVNHTSERIWKEGIIEIENYAGRKIKCYSYEKTICDFIKNVDKFSWDYVSKVFEDYMYYEDKNVDELKRLANVMKIKNEELIKYLGGIITDD